jgi:DNA-binding response OmpR family regulator
LKNNFNILLVDNSNDTHALFKELISNKNNINIFTSLSLEESFKIIFNFDIDLIITESNISKINGIKLIEFLNKNKDIKNIPVIFYTLNNNYKEELYAYKLGALDFIYKSINPEILKIKILNYINMLQKEKKYSVLLEDTQNIIIKQSKAATIGTILNTTIKRWKNIIDVISLTNCGIRFKLENNNFDTLFFNKKLSTINLSIDNISTNINSITSFFIYEKEKTNSLLFDIMDKTINILEPILKMQNIDIISEYKITEGINVYHNDILQVFINIVNSCIDIFIKEEILNPKIHITIKEKNSYQIVIIKINNRNNENEIGKTYFNNFTLKKDSLTNIELELYVCKVILQKHLYGSMHIEKTKDSTLFYVKIKNIKENKENNTIEILY